LSPNCNSNDFGYRLIQDMYPKGVVLQEEEDVDSEIMADLKDSKVETVVKTRLLFKPEVSGLNIEVEAKRGTVTLSGKVKSEAERDLAVAIVKRTDDVKKVVDKRQVVS
jgi:hyperosmotically inducible protein